MIAKHAELIVRRSPFDASPASPRGAGAVADSVGNLGGDPGDRTDVCVRLTDHGARDRGIRRRGRSGSRAGPGGTAQPARDLAPEGQIRDSIDESRRLRALWTKSASGRRPGMNCVLPAVSPNHVAIVCPDGPRRLPGRAAHASPGPLTRRSYSHLHASRRPR